MPALKNAMRPVHPGEVLREEYLAPMGLSANALAQAIGVPANRVSAIVAGERSVTADTALRLARALGTTPTFWLNLQQSYELRLAEQDKETAAAIREIRRVVA
jgi:addiction module HigA family antidote